MPPHRFGGEEDVNYARNLWKTMVEAGYAGKGGLMSRPYTGQHPHGAILDTIEGQIALQGNCTRLSSSVTTVAKASVSPMFPTIRRST